MESPVVKAERTACGNDRRTKARRYLVEWTILAHFRVIGRSQFPSMRRSSVEILRCVVRLGAKESEIKPSAKWKKWV